MTEPVPATRSTPGLTIAGFVISIVALLLSFAGGGLIPAVVAIVLIVIGNRRGPSQLGRAGTIISIVAIVLSVVIVVARVNSGG